MLWVLCPIDFVHIGPLPRIMLPYSSLAPPQQTPILLHNPVQMSSLWNFLRSIPWPWALIKSRYLMNAAEWVNALNGWKLVREAKGERVRNEDAGALKCVRSWAREVGLQMRKEGKLQRKEGGAKADLWFPWVRMTFLYLTYFFREKGNMVTTELKLPTEERHWEAFVERGQKIRSFGDTHCFCCYCCYK